MSEKIIYKRKPLTSFAIGDTLRIIQSNDELFYGENVDTNLTKTSGNLFEYSDEKLSFKYLMNNESYKNVSKLVNNSYSEEFRKWAENNQLNDESEVFYATDKMKFEKSKSKLFQINKKCYIMDNNRYCPNNEDNEEWKSYSIYQKYNDLLNNDYNLMNSLISSNINNYDETFLNLSYNVENKSIPIYDLNKNALKDLYVIRLFNQEEILKVLEENNLMYLSGACLFNSSTYQNDVKDFDSILISNIYNEIIIKFEDEENRNEKFEKLFQSIFKRVPKESLYRILIPIGKIDVSNSGKKANEETQYLYSLNLQDSPVNNFIETNYFSLKNLSNPEMDYNYNIPNIDQYLNTSSEIVTNISGYQELNPSYYNFDNRLKFDTISEFQSKILDELSKYINENNMYKTSADFIAGSGVLDKMVQEFREFYSNTDDDTIFKIFYSDELLNNEEKEMYLQAFKIFMYNNKNINLDENAYIISKDELSNKILELYKEFKPSLDVIIARLQNENDKRLLKDVFDTIIHGSEKYESAVQYLKGDNNLSIYVTESDIKIVNDRLSTNNILNKKIDSRLKFDQNLNYSSLFSDISKLNGNSELLYKMEEYNSHLNDLFKHNNAFKLSGYLYGIRKYNNTGVNSENDIWFSYNYDLDFDKQFLEDLNSSKSISKRISKEELLDVIKDQYKLIEEIVGENTPMTIYEVIRSNIDKINEFSYIQINDLILDSKDLKKYKAELDNIEKIFFKDKDNTFIISTNYKKMKSYYETILALQKIEFGEIIEGQHYYKEENHSKSNIFSINVNNSGFGYKVYELREVIKLLSNEDKSLLPLVYKDSYSLTTDVPKIQNAIQNSDFYIIFYKDNMDKKIEEKNNKNEIIKTFADHSMAAYKNFDLLENSLFFKYTKKTYYSITDKIIDNLDIILNYSNLSSTINEYLTNNDVNEFKLYYKEHRYEIQDEFTIALEGDIMKNSLVTYIINLLNKFKSYKKYGNLDKLNDFELLFLDKITKIDEIFNAIASDVNLEYNNIFKEGELIRAKYKMQKYFENSVRKSIHRYIPANTTLWKVQFTGK